MAGVLAGSRFQELDGDRILFKFTAEGIWLQEMSQIDADTLSLLREISQSLARGEGQREDILQATKRITER